MATPPHMAEKIFPAGDVVVGAVGEGRSSGHVLTMRMGADWGVAMDVDGAGWASI